ncbi:MAG TPA: sigma factor [Ktedonobacteraceae bacterium]|nr:sigma factor [Ktedonobacteraceae bacterium]
MHSGSLDDSEDNPLAVHQISAQAAESYHDALGALYDRHGTAIYSLALYVLGDEASAEDLTIEVFARVGRHSALLGQSDDDNIVWLLRLAHGLALVALQNRNQNSQLEDVTNRQIAAQKSDDVLALMPQRYRWTLTQAFYLGLSCKEIGEHIGQSPDQVACDLRQAMRALAGLLDDNGLTRNSDVTG